jgi:hypothetical protein
MDKDDEIISRIMKAESSEYIVDDGFTAGVVKSLPKRKMMHVSRRTLLLALFSMVGFVVAGIFAWDGIVDLAVKTGKAVATVATTGNVGVLTIVTLSLAIAATLTALVWSFERTEDVR